MSAIADVEDAVDLEQTPNPEIEFKDVCFSYGGRQILDNVSFKVKGGQTIGAIGLIPACRPTPAECPPHFSPHRLAAD
jgi:ABC-type multidrug transport system fused ATPase/permease subunit